MDHLLLHYDIFFLISNENFIEGQPMCTRCKHRTAEKIRMNNDQSDLTWNEWKKPPQQTPSHTKFERIKA